MSLFPTVLSFPLPPLLSHAPLDVRCVLALTRASTRYTKKKVKASSFCAGLNKVDAKRVQPWFNRIDVTVNPNAHWSSHHLHLELPLAGAEFIDD